VDDAEGKVAAVSSAQYPTAATGQVGPLLQGLLFPELGPATGVVVMVTAGVNVVDAIVGGGCKA